MRAYREYRKENTPTPQLNKMIKSYHASFAPPVRKNAISLKVLNIKLDVNWAGRVIFWNMNQLPDS